MLRAPQVMAKSTLKPLVALARERLARTTGARVGATLAAVTAIVFGGVAVSIRLAEGQTASVGDVLPTAARWCAWLAAAPVALAAAHARPEVDRRDGIEDLAATRGAWGRELEAARTLATMLEITLVVGAPLLALALLGAGLSGTFSLAWRSLGAALGGVAYAGIVGVTIGGIAAACGRLVARYGRSVLVAVIVVPWLIADLTGQKPLSIPGALDAVLAFTLGGRGGS